MRITRQAGDRGTGTAIRELRAEARELPPEAFEDRHGAAFLLLTAADLSVPRGPESTEVQLMDDGAARGESTASLALIAFPLRRGEHSRGHLITLGRAPTNDVVIPDLSISRFHAFVKEGEGHWRMLDAGSTNGSTVNGRNVPQQGTGHAVELKSGDNVRLGQVELTFLDVTALLAFIAKLER